RPAASGREAAPRVQRRSRAFHRGDDTRVLGEIRAGSRGKGAQIADCAGSDDRAGERDAVSVGLPGVVAEGLARNDIRVAEVLTQPTRIYGHDLGDIIAFAFINKLPIYRPKPDAPDRLRL